MAIYIVCPNCRVEYSSKRNSCPQCGFPKPKKAAAYRIKIEYRGRVYRKQIKGIPYRLAQEIEAEIKRRVIEGDYDLLDKRTVDINLSDFAAEYFELEKNKKSIDREKLLFERYILPSIGNKLISVITKIDVEKMAKIMLDNGLSPRTAQYAAAVLRHMLNKAVDMGYLKVNPLVRLKTPTKDNRRIRFLTKEEASALLAELKKRSQQTYEIAYLSLYTGMRAGEIFNLKWSDIDFNNDIIHIKDPKSGENRTAYMTKSIKQLLNERYNRLKPNSDELVFKARNGGKITRISKAFERAVKKLGLNDGITDPRDKVVFHTLRHTFASWLAIQGTPIYTIKELMGHKTLAMTERYSHLIPDTKREAVKKLEK